MDVNYMLEIIPSILSYFPVTLLLGIVCFFFSVLIGFLVALLRLSQNKLLSGLAAVYISFFRGVPTVVQLFLIYFGLPQIFAGFANVNGLTAAIIAFSIKESSYLAEIFRAALNSVDKGQVEAGLSVGMSASNIYREIILPQAVVNALPGAWNVFISLFKETSIVFTIGIVEMFAQARLLASSSTLFFETYLVVGLIYWVIVIFLSWLQIRLENTLMKPYVR
ncbi:amino acid permease [Aerococcus urinaehominis]|uniref:Amino acid permease n=1 Tax=Aerococcus urinaehominis TaxID=128944 RepID=A0A0X8FMJ8_9LACT|nr:amino acid ABC transporter permease [Aerococcus urinaehominis]AMB99829.1 amino acid permease [Aerococcus urinaehominis]SDM55536.1 putative amino-acid transport system permease protein [Aerococcus urinaehominis]